MDDVPLPSAGAYTIPDDCGIDAVPTVASSNAFCEDAPLKVSSGYEMPEEEEPSTGVYTIPEEDNVDVVPPTASSNEEKPLEPSPRPSQCESNEIEEAPLPSKGAYTIPEECSVDAVPPTASSNAFSEDAPLKPMEQPQCESNEIEEAPLPSKGAYTIPEECNIDAVPPTASSNAFSEDAPLKPMEQPQCEIEEAPLPSKGAYTIPEECSVDAVPPTASSNAFSEDAPLKPMEQPQCEIEEAPLPSKGAYTIPEECNIDAVPPTASSNAFSEDAPLKPMANQFDDAPLPSMGAYTIPEDCSADAIPPSSSEEAQLGLAIPTKKKTRGRLSPTLFVPPPQVEAVPEFTLPAGLTEQPPKQNEQFSEHTAIVPSGASTSIDEFGPNSVPGNATSEVVVDEGPLEQRLTNKNWKTRSAAYSELTKLFETCDTAVFQQYSQYLPAMSKDSNATALERGLEAISMYANKYGAPAAHIISDVLPGIVSKGFAGRPATKTRAVQACLILMEIDTPAPVVAEIMKGFTNKIPKCVSQAIATLTTALKTYGSRTFAIKPLLKEVPPLYNHTDRSVRTEAKLLLTELYRWVGPVVKPHIESLRPAQIKELDTAFAAVEAAATGPAVPEKYLRSQKVEPEAPGAKPTAARAAPVWDPMKGVDVATAMTSQFKTNVESSSWKERKSAVDSLVEVVSSPRIHINDASVLIDITRILRKLISDVNVGVIVKAAESVKHLAIGLKRDFSRPSNMLLSDLFEALKEKKIGVTNAVVAALESLAVNCIPMHDMIKDINKALKHKNPTVRTSTLRFMTNMMALCTDDEAVKSIEPIGAAAVKSMDDPVKEPREAAMKLLIAMHNHAALGEERIGPLIEKLDRMKCQAVRSNLGTCPAVKPVKKGKKVEVEVEETDVVTEIVDISGEVTSKMIKMLNSDTWKDRQDALTELEHLIKIGTSKSSSGMIAANVGLDLMPALRSRINDGVMNVQLSTLKLLCRLPVVMGPSVERHAKIVLGPVCMAFNTKKKPIREIVSNAVDAWTQQIGLSNMLPFMAQAVNQEGSGRLEALNWLIAHTKKDHSELDWAPLLKPLVMCLQDRVGAIRRHAETLLKKLVESLGVNVLHDAIRDFSPAVLNNIQGSISKIASDGETEPVPVAASPPKNKRRARPQSPRPARHVESSDDAPLLFSDGLTKESRVKRDKRKSPWMVGEIREELIVTLKSDMASYVSPSLHTVMFSSSFKDHVTAFEQLSTAVTNHIKETIECVDLLLKWCAWRIDSDMTNPKALLGCLGFLAALFTVLETAEYRLTDHDVKEVLPEMVSRAGSNLEKVRSKMNELIQRICRVYSVNKVFGYLIDATKSRNGRTRVESLDIMSTLVSKYAIDKLCVPHKALPVIVAAMKHRDSANLVMSILIKAHASIGNELFKYLGDGDRERLEKKLTTSAPVPVPSSAIPTTPRRVTSTPVRKPVRKPVVEDPYTLDLGELPARDKRGLPAVGSSPVLEASRLPLELSDNTPTLPCRSQPAFEEEEVGTVSKWLRKLNSEDSDEQVGGLKEIEEAVVAFGKEENQIIIDRADTIAQALGSQMALPFDQDAESTRRLKHVISTTANFFAQPKLARLSPPATLSWVIRNLIMQICDDQSIQRANGLVMRAANIAMSNILSNSKRVFLFRVMFELLSLPAETPSQRATAPGLSRDFVKLVGKCLAKLTDSAIKGRMHGIDLADILDPAAKFLDAYRDAMWPGHDQTPIINVKKILTGLGTVCGPTRIKKALIGFETGSFVSEYMLDLAGELDSKSTTENAVPQTSTAENAVPQTSTPQRVSRQLELKRELTGVFKLIGNPVTANAGISALHRFMVAHPEIDVEPAISTTSDLFQGYIRRGLARIKEEENETGTDEYMTRLQELRAKIDVPTRPTTSHGTTSVEVLKARLASMTSKSPAVASPLPSTPVRQITDARPSTPLAPNSANLDAIKKRLAAIRGRTTHV